MLKNLSLAQRITTVFWIIIFLAVLANFGILRLFLDAAKPLEKRLPQGLVQIEKTSYQDEQIRKIQFYDEVLTEAMSSYVATSERKWKYRYQELLDEWKPVIQQAVSDSVGDIRKTFLSLQHTRMLLSGHEFQAMEFADSGQGKKAKDTMEGVVYWQLKQGIKRSVKDYADIRGQQDEEGTFTISTAQLRQMVREMDTHISRTRVLALVLLVFFVIASLATVQWLIRPVHNALKELDKGSEMIIGGDFGHQIIVNGRDEIARIAAVINGMARRLREKGTVGSKRQSGIKEPRTSEPKIKEQDVQMDALKQELKAAHETLKEQLVKVSEELQWYRSTVEFSSEGHLVMDESGEIRIASGKIPELLGFSPEELIGRPFDQVIRAVDEKNEPIPYVRRPVTLVLATGVPIEASVLYLDKEGKEHQLYSKISPMMKEGKVSGIIEEISRTDVKKTVEQEEEWFISTVTQRFKSPLASVYESVSLIYDGVLGPIGDEQKKFLSVLLADINRLQNDVEDFLDFTKMKSGNIFLHKEFLNLEELVNLACRDVREQESSKEIRIFVSVDYELQPQIYADRQEVLNILTALIDCVLRASSGDTVEVKVQADHDQAICTVFDQSGDLCQEDLTRLLESVRPEDRERIEYPRGPEGGSLARVKVSVERQGGKIRAGSFPGKGKGFELILPRLSARDVFYDHISRGLQKSIVKSKPLAVILFRLKKNQKNEEMLSSELVNEMLDQVKQLLRSPYDGMVHANTDILFVLPLTDLKAAGAVAKRAIKVFKTFLDKGKYPFELEHKIAVYPEQGGRPEDLLFSVGYI
ncbi:MAG: PAS domain S-box protein [Candidatus Omnitrophica bacterium]|nr:PAS domain S-box protein [Candidatus Omnitrophota bacterium]